MNAWTALAAQPFFRDLSFALSHFLWQGTAVAAGFAAADFALRRRGAGARARYALACAALAAMVALPAATFLRRATEPSRPRGAGVSVFAASAEIAPAEKAAVLTSAALGRSLRLRHAALRSILLAAWLAGVLALSLRLLAGWAFALRLAEMRSRPARAEIAASFARLAKRLAVSRPVRLLESAMVQVPTALGWIRPVVLLPVSGLTGLSSRQIEALLAHELAHLRRHDYLVNLVQCAAETLLFYHPAVWWVSGRIRAERENCCDDIAVGATGDARLYAAALVELEERRSRRGVPALALAADGGSLLRRVARLLPGADAAAHAGSRRAAGSVALACLILLGAGARVSSLAPEEARPSSIPASAAAAPARAPAAPSAAPLPVFSAVARANAPALPDSDPALPAVPAPLPDAPEAEETQADAEADSGAAAPEKAAPAQQLTADELSSFRVHGVTPEFVGELAALGYTRARSGEILALRIHGVSPADIAEFQKRFGRISLDRCVSFRIHGVTPAWLSQLAAAGLSGISPGQAESLRIHGVTPEFLRRFQEAGYRDLTADEAVSLRVHGVDPGDAAAWIAGGLPRPGIEELVSARIHGVDARFAGEMRAEGVGLALDTLVSLRIHGVTASFLREMKALGLSPLSAEDAVALRIHGVTPEFVREIKALGVSALTPEDATSLRIHGVTADFVAGFGALGYSRLSADELTSLRIHGVTPDEARTLNRDAGARLTVEDLVDIHLEGRRSK